MNPGFSSHWFLAAGGLFSFPDLYDVTIILLYCWFLQ